MKRIPAILNGRCHKSTVNEKSSYLDGYASVSVQDILL